MILIWNMMITMKHVKMLVEKTTRAQRMHQRNSILLIIFKKINKVVLPSNLRLNLKRKFIVYLQTDQRAQINSPTRIIIFLIKFCNSICWNIHLFFIQCHYLNEKFPFFFSFTAKDKRVFNMLFVRVDLVYDHGRA